MLSFLECPHWNYFEATNDEDKSSSEDNFSETYHASRTGNEECWWNRWWPRKSSGKNLGSRWFFDVFVFFVRSWISIFLVSFFFSWFSHSSICTYLDRRLHSLIRLNKNDQISVVYILVPGVSFVCVCLFFHFSRRYVSVNRVFNAVDNKERERGKKREKYFRMSRYELLICSCIFVDDVERMTGCMRRIRRIIWQMIRWKEEAITDRTSNWSNKQRITIASISFFVERESFVVPTGNTVNRMAAKDTPVQSNPWKIRPSVNNNSR